MDFFLRRGRPGRKRPKEGKDGKDGCILIRSYLPANANYTWTLQSGVAPAAPVVNPVRLTQTGPNYEITNGLTGVRIVSPAGNPKPWNRAPIQGVLLPGGVWTGAGASPNMLYSEAHNAGGSVGAALTTPMYTATGYSLTVVDSGPLKVVVKASYTFTRPGYRYGNTAIGAAGSGHYTAFFTLYAEREFGTGGRRFRHAVLVLPSFLFRVASGSAQGFAATILSTARARANPVCGYEEPLAVHEAAPGSPVVITAGGNLSNGQRVIVEGVKGIASANGDYFVKTAGYPGRPFRALLRCPPDNARRRRRKVLGRWRREARLSRGECTRPRGCLSRYRLFSRPARHRTGAMLTAYRKLMTNYAPAAHSAGFYVMTYNSSGGPGSPVFGIYTGRSSKQIYSAIGPSMPGLYSSDRHWITGQKDAGIQVENLLRGPDGRVAPLVHRNWAIWIGTRADVLATTDAPAARDRAVFIWRESISRASTPINWNIRIRPEAGNGCICRPKEPGSSSPASETARPNAGLSIATSGCSLRRKHPYGVVTCWRSGRAGTAPPCSMPSTPRLAWRVTFRGPLRSEKATSVRASVITNWAFRPRPRAPCSMPSYGFEHHARTEKDRQSRAGAVRQRVLGQRLVSHRQQQRRRLRTDQSGAAVSAVPRAIRGLRAVAALPRRAPRGRRSAYPVADFKHVLQPDGRGELPPRTIRLLFSAADSELHGVCQIRRTCRWPTRNGWPMPTGSCPSQTPPEPRFGNLRKGYSNGDGNTEANVRTGMLATAMYPVNPTVAGNLMWAWRQSNSPDAPHRRLSIRDHARGDRPLHSADRPASWEHQCSRLSFRGALRLRNARTRPPCGLSTAASIRRAGTGTMTMDRFRFTPTGAPLAIDWNANLYSPDTPGRFMHNSVVWDSETQAPVERG